MGNLKTKGGRISNKFLFLVMRPLPEGRASDTHSSKGDAVCNRIFHVNAGGSESAAPLLNRRLKTAAP
jgi:hypothetical protein